MMPPFNFLCRHLRNSSFVKLLKYFTWTLCGKMTSHVHYILRGHMTSLVCDCTFYFRNSAVKVGSPITDWATQNPHINLNKKTSTGGRSLQADWKVNPV